MEANAHLAKKVGKEVAQQLKDLLEKVSKSALGEVDSWFQKHCCFVLYSGRDVGSVEFAPTEYTQRP